MYENIGTMTSAVSMFVMALSVYAYRQYPEDDDMQYHAKSLFLLAFAATILWFPDGVIPSL